MQQRNKSKDSSHNNQNTILERHLGFVAVDSGRKAFGLDPYCSKASTKSLPTYSHLRSFP